MLRLVYLLFSALGLALLLPAAATGATSPYSADWREKVSPWVLERAIGTQEAEFVLFLTEQADLSAAASLPNKEAKGRYVFKTLRATAERSQQAVIADLDVLGTEYRPFWIANMIWVRADRSVLQHLAQRVDVAHVHANPTVRFEEPQFEAQSAQLLAIEWGLTRTNAPTLWAAGVRGQGAVIGGQDTGYDWDHPALQGKYRGWNGASADHNFNWHDSIHSGGGTCGPDSALPCDDQTHGTHTMGTMVGDDGGANQVGMAPDAQWIGCRNMDQGNGTPTTYSECFQWFIAPTDLAGNNPNPAMAPHVINNSWACSPGEGCTDPNILQTVAANTRAAGIVVVVSSGNSGPGCSSINNPAAIYDASFTVGSTTNSDAMSGFSSRGPVTVDGSNRMKPDIVAPGSFIRSTFNGGGYGSLSGTSMAGPHVAGAVALLISAVPSLAGDVDAIENCLRAMAFPISTTQTCGGIPGSQIPNNTFGAGRLELIWPLPAICGSSTEIFSDGFESGSTTSWSSIAN